MKILEATAPGKGSFRDIPTPVPTGDEVLVEVAYCGICGTDYALFSGNSAFIENDQVTYPIRLGHEWSGIVAEVGENVTRVKPGDRIIGDNFVSCNECAACKKGDFGNCTARMNVGTIDPIWPGAFAEYYLLPERHVYRIADNVPLLDAALCEPLSVAYGGIKAMDIGRDSIVVVIGTGSIGMSAAALALERGAGEVYMIGRNDFKLECAMKLGITGIINSKKNDSKAELLRLTGGRYADCMLECSGNPGAFDECITLTRRGGKIALIGFYEQKIPGFDIDAFVTKELRMVGIMGQFGNIEAVAEIMARRDLKMKNVITDIVGFDECIPAFMPKDTGRIIKTMVKF